MIYVKLSDNSFWYDIYNIIRMFFKKDEIILLEHESDDANKSDDINESSEFNVVNVLISIVINKDTNSTDSVTVSTTKNKKELSRQVYKALSKYTGKQMPWGMLTGVRPAKIPYEMMEKGKASEEILSKLEKFYFISSQKAALAYRVAETEKEILKRNTKDMVSLYIGIPFCKTRCHYCSFTSNCINRNAHLVDKYIDSLKKEMQIINEDILKKERLKIQTIYVGGGTPTSISKEQLADLLQFIENTLDLQHLEEYTLEAGRPDTIDREKLMAIKNSKTSRISINPQTMNMETLKAIGRSHTPEELKDAFYLAREIGFKNINMDVIVGLPGEDVSMFEHTMKEIQSMNPESLTVHSLALKKASKLKEDLDNKEEPIPMPHSDLIIDEMANTMTEMAYNYALSMGMHPYYLYRQKNIAGNLENVGYCKPSFESIYNIQIMEEKQTIVAFGAGAVTKVLYSDENRLERAFNVKNLEEYINRVVEMTERKKKLWE